MTELSIIVPVYNTKRYLSRCIESILCQTFNDFELILVDDGSTDGSANICDHYKAIDNRVKVIHKRNEGVSKTRNTGLKCASGKYITFCDSDDYYSPDWIEKLLNAARKYQADCVSVMLNQKIAERSIEINQDNDLTDYVVRRLLQSDGWAVWNRLYRTEIIKNHDVQFCADCEDFGEDLSFNLLYCLYCKKIVVLGGDGYHHMIREGSIMKTNTNQVRFNSLNEISYFLFTRLKREENKHLLSCFPLIHYLIIDDQHRRLNYQGRTQEIKLELNKINKYDWMKQHIKKYLSSSWRYKRYFPDEKEWKLSVLKSHYLIHHNYLLLRIERKIRGLRL